MDSDWIYSTIGEAHRTSLMDPRNGSGAGSICQSLFLMQQGGAYMDYDDEDGKFYDDVSSNNVTARYYNYYSNNSIIFTTTTTTAAATLPEFTVDSHQMAYWRIRQIAYGYLLPTILVLGIIGNCINIVVFSQRKLWVQQDVMEKSAMIGLVCLALADLVFCVIGFPSVFVEARHFTGPRENNDAAVLALYYTTYRGSVLNIFVFMSTWFIVTLSVERYVAIAHPFKAKSYIKVGRTLFMKLCVVIASIVINIPDFLRYNIRYDPCQIPDCGGCYFAEPNPIMHGTTFAFVYSIVWHTVGTFAPLVILTFCNVRLLIEIYKSTSRDKNLTGSASQSRDPTKITVILISIVTFFFILVFPSMIMSFLAECVLDSSQDIQYFQIAVVVTNLCQALNFSLNFILYCAVSPKFRQGLSNSSCISSRTESSTLTANNMGGGISSHAKSTTDTSCNYELMDHVPA